MQPLSFIDEPLPSYSKSSRALAAKEGSKTPGVYLTAGAADVPPMSGCLRHALLQPVHRGVMQDEIGSLKTRFGQPLSQPKRLGTKANDMSQAGLQILQLELDNLHAERAQRERKLDMLLGRLRKACVELDEDDSAAAAAAHPSLQHHRFAP